MYGGPLAEGCAYQWVGVYWEQVRAWVCLAHRNLAEATTGYPHRAAQLMVKAARIEPADEDTRRQAMQACAALGDTAGIRTLLNDLSEHLDATGGQPSRDTAELAERLLQSPESPATAAREDAGR